MSGAVIIGTSGSTTTLNGTTYINKIDTITPTTNLEFYPSITTGDITIAKNTRGNIIIADGATAGTSNLIIVGTSTVSNIYLRGTTLNINDQGSGTTKLSGAIELYSALSPKYSYTYGIDKIGGRYNYGGTTGESLTIYGDGYWRNYLYANNVPPGVYLFQYWANPGGMTYSNVQQRIHLSPTAFTGVSNVIYNITLYSQSYINPVPNIYNSAIGQVALPFTVVVDSSNPHICFAMFCNTNFNGATYHGLTLTRLA
jgi:hypothetical protein